MQTVLRYEGNLSLGGATSKEIENRGSFRQNYQTDRVGRVNLDISISRVNSYLVVRDRICKRLLEVHAQL